MTAAAAPRRSAAPLILLAATCLVAALWGGLARIGWGLPLRDGAVVVGHGPLMLVGVFGTVVGLERARAMQKGWPWAAPVANGIAGVLVVLGLLAPSGVFATAGALVLFVASASLARAQPAMHLVVLALGAASYLVGCAAWLSGSPVFSVVPWWTSFLVLTIAGERLELGRLVRLSPTARSLFALAVGTLLAGLVIAFFAPPIGARVRGLGTIALALWMLRWDVARRTIRGRGLPRFIAACLLPGFVWLGISGALALVHGDVPAGPLYDATLHALLVGFVFSMIFGHAPTILPAVAGVAVPYRTAFYAPLVVLHASLVLRVAGDLLGAPSARAWGGLLDAVAILLFVATTGITIRSAAAAKRV